MEEEEAISDCLCCLGDQNLFNIFDTHECEGKEEVYVAMLKSCFDISIEEESGVNGMCEKCILKLREAYYLKNDIINNVNGDIFYIVVKKEDLNETENEIQMNKRQNIKTYFSNQKGSDIVNVQGKDDGNHQFGLRTRSYILQNICKRKIDFNSKDNERLLEKVITDESRSTDNNETINVCDKCGKIFPSPKHLTRHMSSHASGPHVCQYCGMVFSNKNTKNAHVWRKHHTKEPYICGQCGERFTTFHKRLNHLQQLHNYTAEYACPYCDKMFYYATYRSTHIRELHLQIRNHKCTVCKMAFFKRSALGSHMASIHGIGEKKHKCPTCGKKFYRPSTLKFHMKRHEEKKHDGKKHEGKKHKE